MPEPTRILDERRNKYAVPALEKALDVLEHLAEQGVPLTQAELARSLGRQGGEIFRILTCLQARDYLRRDPASNAYALTLKLFELSRTHSPFEPLLRAAQPLMRNLVHDIRESCHLSVLYRDQVLVLTQEESPNPFRLSVEVGSIHDPLRTTSGRILLSQLSEADQRGLLDRHPECSAGKSADRARLLDRLTAIRSQGYERSEGERFVGGLDLGVPIGDGRASIKAALTIASLKSAASPDMIDFLAPLRACADRIAEQAGLLKALDLSGVSAT